MSAIKELNRDIANLQKVQYRLQEIKGLRFGDPRITQTAHFIREKFDIFEQRWRDVLSKNDFFFFGFPKFAVYDGHIPHHIKPHDNEANQNNFDNGCLQLEPDIDRLIKKMRDTRSMLLNQQNQGTIDIACNEFDTLNFEVFKIGQEGTKKGSDMMNEFKQWDADLQKSLERLRLSKRFSSIFADSSDPLHERVQNREQTIAHYVDTLASNPNEPLQQGPTHMHFNQSKIGVVNTGTMSDIEQINVSINELQINHREVAESLDVLAKEVESAELAEEVKGPAIEAIKAVSTELAAPAEERKAWRFTKYLKELKDLFIATGSTAEAYQKIQPLLNNAIVAIHKAFPQLPII